MDILIKKVCAFMVGMVIFSGTALSMQPPKPYYVVHTDAKRTRDDNDFVSGKRRKINHNQEPNNPKTFPYPNIHVLNIHPNDYVQPVIAVPVIPVNAINNASQRMTATTVKTKQLKPKMKATIVKTRQPKPIKTFEPIEMLKPNLESDMVQKRQYAFQQQYSSHIGDYKPVTITHLCTVREWNRTNEFGQRVLITRYDNQPL